MLHDWKLRTKYRYLKPNFTHTFMPFAGLVSFYSANKDFSDCMLQVEKFNFKNAQINYVWHKYWSYCLQMHLFYFDLCTMPLVQFIIQTNKCTTYIYIYILTIFYILLVLLHVLMHSHHLQRVLFFYFAKVIRSLGLETR
jgi:hypothetical protein